MSYQIVNGIPKLLQPSLEKIDFTKLREEAEKDPQSQLKKYGFTDKQCFIITLSDSWEEIKTIIKNGSDKETIVSYINNKVST